MYIGLAISEKGLWENLRGSNNYNADGRPKKSSDMGVERRRIEAIGLVIQLDNMDKKWEESKVMLGL